MTTLEFDEIFSMIDNDLLITRELRRRCGDEKIVLNINIAEALCNTNQDDFKILNCQGDARTAVMTGILHHLIIDYGLSIDLFYRNISILYDSILLEFPEKEDPMVKLLIRKKNENILWDWESIHLPICEKFFEIIFKEKISDTRSLISLKKKDND